MPDKEKGSGGIGKVINQSTKCVVITGQCGRTEQPSARGIDSDHESGRG